MSTYTGSAFATKYAAYLIYKGSATAAALNISQPKIGYVYDITEGGTLTPGNITVQQGDAVVYLAQGWTHCNNGGADQAIAELSASFDALLEEIGETDFSKFALKTELPTVPTNVSAFTNDAGYLTQHQSLANYALKTEIPNVSNFAPYSAIPQNVSQLTNDAHYLTEAVVSNRVRKVDDLTHDTDAADGEIVQLTTDGRFYRFTEPQAEDESGTWTVVNQPADIASNDQILSQNNSGKLTATLGMSYNSTNQHLELKGIGDAVIAYVDMAVFIKDGMLENVEKYTTPEQGVSVAVPYLKFTFNTDSGKSVIRISFADLIDTFDGSNVDLTSAFVKAAQYSAPAIGDSMDVAIGKLLKGHEDNAAAIDTKQNTLTFDDAPITGSNNPVKSGGIKTAIDAVAASAAQGLKCVDLTTYQGGTDGEIVKHTGPDTAQYTNGYEYKLTAKEFESGDKILIVDAPYSNVKQGFDAASLISDKYFVKVANGILYHGREPMYDDDYDLYVGEKGYPAVGDTILGLPNYSTKMTPCYEVTEVVSSTYPFVVKFVKNDFERTLTINQQISCYNFTNGDGVTITLVGSWSDDYYTRGLSLYDTYHSVEVYHDGKIYEVAVGDITCALSDDLDVHEWNQHDSQPSSASDVSALQQRMTAAETAISGKQATITGAASTITTANLTASKILGSDANGKVAATSIATTDAEDAVSKKHEQNTDTKIQSGNNKVEVSASGTAITGNGSVSGNFSVSGNLNVTGKETVEEIVNIKSENNLITLRDGAQTAIASGSLSGTKVENYDGLGNDLLFGTDASGVFRIGDDGGTLEPIATRDETANLTDGQLMKWDAANQRMVGINDIRANTVNGAPLSNAASYFYGVSTSAANATQKEVSIPSITTLNAGQVIVVLPTVSSDTINNATLKLNDFAAYPIVLRNTYGANWQTWVGNTPSTFLFVGNEWRLIAKGYDTAYNILSVADGIAGTSTVQTVVRADYLQQIIHGQIDKFVGTRAMTEDAYWDLVAAGTVQADTLYITYDNDWEG